MVVSLYELGTTDQLPESVPVMYNVHMPSWPNPYGTQMFYIPSYGLQTPKSDDDEHTSPIVFRIYGDPEPSGDESKLRARLDMKVTISKPSHATPDMTPVPATLLASLAIPYLDKDGTLLSQYEKCTIEQHGDTLSVYALLNGKWAAACYGAMSGKDDRLPPPHLAVGVSSVQAFVPALVTLQQMDDPNFRTELKLGPSADLSQYRIYRISGFATVPVPVAVPCSSMGHLYRYVTNGSSIAIGCRKPERLRNLSKGKYIEVTELNYPDYYRVYRERDDMTKYLVLPAAYRIGFHPRETAENGRSTFLPGIVAQATIDTSALLQSSVYFQMMLLPDLPPYMRRELEEKIRSLTSHPSLEYPGQMHWDYSIKIQELEDIHVSKQGVAFHLTIPVTLQRALLLRDSLSKLGAHGSIRFEAMDGMTFESAVILELGRITGPWSTGPIEVTVSGNEVTLTNMLKQPIDVKSVWVKYGPEGMNEIPAELKLDMAENFSRTIPLPSAPIEAYPVYTLGDSGQELDFSMIYLNEISTSMEFLDLIDHNNHQIERMEVSLRIPGYDHVIPVPLAGDPPAGKAAVVFPFSHFFSSPAVEIQVKFQHSQMQLQSTQWIPWNLPVKGTVVSLTWELLQQNIQQ